jgi:hypothetical protein
VQVGLGNDIRAESDMQIQGYAAKAGRIQTPPAPQPAE